MIVTKKALPRRTFLRGMGVTLGLPLLGAMSPAFSTLAATPSVRRLGYIYLGMGMNPVPWIPTEDGKMTQLSPSLHALQPFLSDTTVITNSELRNMAYPTGHHAAANAIFLSNVKPKRTEGNDYELATTVDQIAAKQFAKDTVIPSLELGTDLIAQVGLCDNGLSCAYQNCLSWSSPTTPLPPEADPRVLFERLFGDGGSRQERMFELRKSRSILDWVTDDMARLQGKLGSSDRVAVTNYLDTIREVERRIQKAEEQSAEVPLPELDRPSSVPANWEDHVKLMFDLQVLALQTDLTRVITFQLAREASTRSYPQIGVSEGHHPVSHHSDDPEKLAQLAKINAYHVSLVAYLVEKLKATPDGDGTLLDHTTYLVGSGMGNPNVHDHTNLPAVVIGGGKGGRHIRYETPKPLANLHLTLLNRAGVNIEKFADSDGRTEELL